RQIARATKRSSFMAPDCRRNIPSCKITLRSEPHPGAAELDVEDESVLPEREVRPHVQAVLAGDLIAESGPAGVDGLRPIEPEGSSPGAAPAAESHQTEPLPELPAQLHLQVGGLLPLVAQLRRSPEVHEGAQIEGRIAEAEPSSGPDAEEQIADEKRGVADGRDVEQLE